MRWLIYIYIYIDFNPRNPIYVWVCLIPFKGANKQCEEVAHYCITMLTSQVVNTHRSRNVGKWWSYVCMYIYVWSNNAIEYDLSGATSKMSHSAFTRKGAKPHDAFLYGIDRIKVLLLSSPSPYIPPHTTMHINVFYNKEANGNAVFQNDTIFAGIIASCWYNYIRSYALLLKWKDPCVCVLFYWNCSFFFDLSHRRHLRHLWWINGSYIPHCIMSLKCYSKCVHNDRNQYYAKRIIDWVLWFIIIVVEYASLVHRMNRKAGRNRFSSGQWPLNSHRI